MIRRRSKPVLRFVQRYRSGGETYTYFRRPGFPRIRLSGLPGSAEFMAGYQAALASAGVPGTKARVLKLYIARATKSTRFKVGISSNPRRRLRTLQTGSALRLVLVATAGITSGKLEREVHRMLAPWRSHGEWFDLGDASGRFLQEIRDANGDVQKLLAVLGAAADFARAVAPPVSRRGGAT